MTISLEKLQVCRLFPDIKNQYLILVLLDIRMLNRQCDLMLCHSGKALCPSRMGTSEEDLFFQFFNFSIWFKVSNLYGSFCGLYQCSMRFVFVYHDDW